MAETCRKLTDLTVEHIRTLRLRDFMMLLVSFVSNLFVVYVLLRCIWQFTPLPQWFTGQYGAWVAAACLIAVPCILSRTRIAQLITLWSLDARKATDEEYEYIKDIILPICEKENKSLEDYEIYIQDTKFMNAYAYGKHFIIITQGLLKSLPKKEVTAEEVNDVVRKAAAGSMGKYLGVVDDECVSMDFVHDDRSSIFAPDQTIVMNGLVKVFAWYDNEWGYSCRCVDLTNYVIEKGL